MSGPAKWILTGGAGFIGANLARSLAERGIRSVVFDNLSRPSAPLNLDWLRSEAGELVTYVPGDVRDERAVDDLMAAHADADAVVHLAAQVAVTTSIEDPLLDFDSNARGSFLVLDAVRRRLPETAFLYVSTNKVYGDLESHRIEELGTRYADADFPSGIPETHPLDPRSPYGCSKAAGDVYALDYAHTYGLRAVSLRQSCIYGPRQFGIEDQGWAAWFGIAAQLGREITIYGSGKQVRDLLHVDDLVELYLLAVQGADACAGKAYNVGGGPANTFSLLELLARLEESNDQPPAVRFADARPADQRVFVCDVSRAKIDLGWEPTTDVDSGIDGLFDWIARHAGAAERLIAAA